MKLLRPVVLLVGFFIVQTTLTYAVLQTADVNKPGGANKNSSSKLISESDQPADAAQSPSALSTGGVGTMHIRLKGASSTPASAAGDSNASEADYPLGKSRTLHPQAVKPDAVSPVIQQVNGPYVENPNTIRTQYRSTKPGSATVSFSPKQDNQ